MSRRALISPRARGQALPDLGGRAAFTGRQRVGRTPRARGRRRAWLARVAVALAVVGGLGGAGAVGWYWLTTSPRFAVSTVHVRGASRLQPSRLAEAAGIVAGTSLFAVDPREVRARLEQLPEVRRAEVIRELPNRLEIVVEERRPFTLVHAGRLHWVDEEGLLLGEERRAVAPEVPMISGLSDEELASMRTAPGPNARAAIALIRALLRSGSSLAAEISEIDVSRADGPVLYTVDGVEVRLGHDDWDERLARLEGVLAQLGGQDVSVVDLRFRDQVVLRKATGR